MYSFAFDPSIQLRLWSKIQTLSRSKTQ